LKFQEIGASGKNAEKERFIFKLERPANLYVIETLFDNGEVVGVFRNLPGGAAERVMQELGILAIPRKSRVWAKAECGINLKNLLSTAAGALDGKIAYSFDRKN